MTGTGRPYQQWLTDPHADQDQASTGTITISRAVFERLSAQADAFRDLRRTVSSADELIGLLIEAPGVRELIMQEYADWSSRQQAGQDASAISREMGWNSSGSTREEAQRRRRDIGEAAREFYERHGHEYRGGGVEWSTGRPAEQSTGHGLAA